MNAEVDSLTLLEREALERAVSRVEARSWREALRRQIPALRVISRNRTGVGFYTDFECPANLRIPDLPPDFDKTPPEVSAVHPDVAGAIFFVVYTKDGAISFLEGASTSSWPETENHISFSS